MKSIAEANTVAVDDIGDMRQRIDEIDGALMALWRERAELSQIIGATRLAAGGTRLVLSRERQVLERFREGIGTEGVQLALLLLRAGRGPL
ncbi:chorismate mutase [Actinoplanes sp. NPDC049802]|uniref:chorismate mutase n=1 Tax=Actinoplanes sp. NPDC049802 TaxID=3154742 RepID=UPI0033F0659B